ncbi:MAG: hypothetical protein HY685_00445 [Chloroflexi bacterium]|nr:hypothetical protein [Chloroflexota bacterium]
MSWIPDPLRTLTLLKRIEAREDPVSDSAELFWLFCTQSLAPEQFTERINVIKNVVHGSPGSGFVDPDTQAAMLRGFEDPSSIATYVADRLESASRTNWPPYQPDQQEDPVRLYVFAHLEAARLWRLLKVEGHSDNTRDALERVRNAVGRLGPIRSFDELWPPMFEESWDAVGNFLLVAEFHVSKGDGKYEDALQFLYEALLNDPPTTYEDKQALAKALGVEWPSNMAEVSQIPAFVREFPWRQGRVSPWFESVDLQEVVDCFEAIRSSRQCRDPEKLAKACQLLSGEYKLSSIQPDIDPYEEGYYPLLTDAQGEYISWGHYWHLAEGWAESRLEPSQLRDYFQKREGETAEQRLRTYFFPDPLWTLLPERARSSLVSADRDLFGGSKSRREAVFNELRIAIEEILRKGLWDPLCGWYDSIESNRDKMRDFVDLRGELAAHGLEPSLVHFEKLCGKEAVQLYLTSRHVPSADMSFISKDLPEYLRVLREARREAEHEPASELPLADPRRLFGESVGIGRVGILPRLARVLLRQRAT